MLSLTGICCTEYFFCLQDPTKANCWWIQGRRPVSKVVPIYSAPNFVAYGQTQWQHQAWIDQQNKNLHYLKDYFFMLDIKVKQSFKSKLFGACFCWSTHPLVMNTHTSQIQCFVSDNAKIIIKGNCAEPDAVVIHAEMQAAKVNMHTNYSQIWHQFYTASYLKWKKTHTFKTHISGEVFTYPHEQLAQFCWQFLLSEKKLRETSPLNFLINSLWLTLQLRWNYPDLFV